MAEFQDSIEIAASAQTVFDYLTTNEGMTAWMGQYADLDPTPGGRFAVDIAGYPVRGEYLVIEPFKRVVVSWGFAGNDELPAGASRVEFLLTPITGGTRAPRRSAGARGPRARARLGPLHAPPRDRRRRRGRWTRPLASLDRLNTDERLRPWQS